jgi:UDP-N-acetylglucosamine--N-acetylmuramyl-(pentapeptide) pyrophosphoryl-undecaprenol N-acetylglucosamine transferase
MAEAGAAEVVEDSELDAAELARRVGELLADPARLEAMATASRSLARPDAADRIAGEVRAAAESFSR